MKAGIWLTTPNVAMVEMAAELGFGVAVFDLEHGIMDPSALEALVGLSAALGVTPFLKVAASERRFVMEGLDRGACGVILPQIEDWRHAKQATAFAKYPPLGKRGASGGRVFGYQRADAQFYETQNTASKCIVMIETKGALRDVADIAALDTVDGLFVGPTDLALSCGRKAYEQSDVDFADIERIAKAAKAAGKSFMWPAWSAREQGFARDLGADTVIVSDEFGALRSGMVSAMTAFLQPASKG